MRSFFVLLLFLMLFACTMHTNNPPKTISTETGEWRLVWHDEFDQPDGSAPDPEKWGYDIGGGGWGNGEYQVYTDSRENSSIQDGALVIQAMKIAEEGRLPEYTSARLVSRDKGDWRYGRFEFRARLPYGQGIWPAIWMLPTEMIYGAWPLSGEIDIMELVGHEPGTVHGTLHYGNPHTYTGQPFGLPAGQRFADDFHTFTLEWEPGEMRWYVDGARYQTQTQWFTSNALDKFPAPFDQRFHLVLNVAVGGQWPGYPDKTTPFPQTMVIDYVRVYQQIDSGK